MASAHPPVGKQRWVPWMLTLLWHWPPADPTPLVWQHSHAPGVFLVWSFPRFWLWRMKLIYTNIRSHKKNPKVFTKSSTIITGVIYIYIYIYMGLTKIVSPKSSGVSMFIVIKSVCHPQTGGVFEKPASWGYNLMRSYSKKTTWWKIHAAKNHDVYHGISGFPQLFLTNP